MKLIKSSSGSRKNNFYPQESHEQDRGSNQYASSTIPIEIEKLIRDNIHLLKWADPNDKQYIDESLILRKYRSKFQRSSRVRATLEQLVSVYIKSHNSKPINNLNTYKIRTQIFEELGVVCSKESSSYGSKPLNEQEFSQKKWIEIEQSITRIINQYEYVLSRHTILENLDKCIPTEKKSTWHVHHATSVITLAPDKNSFISRNDLALCQTWMKNFIFKLKQLGHSASLSAITVAHEQPMNPQTQWNELASLFVSLITDETLTFGQNYHSLMIKLNNVIETIKVSMPQIILKRILVKAKPADPWFQLFRVNPNCHIRYQGNCLETVSHRKLRLFSIWVKNIQSQCRATILNF